MKIYFYDKIILLWKLYKYFEKLPHNYRREFLFNPINVTRYEEFIILLKFIEEKQKRDLKILDVSSPHMLAYILSNENTVLKTNIDEEESRFIKKNSRLIFKKENALNLSFNDNMFDLCYSISVLEHIYKKYDKALAEIILVTKPGGYIYITFPVSNVHKEEWLNQDIYSDQYKNEGKTFFQYRFDERDVSFLIESLKNVTIELNCIFWERFNGAYDLTINVLKKRFLFKHLSILKNYFINVIVGLFLMRSTPGGFKKACSFGNMHLIFKKE